MTEPGEALSTADQVLLRADQFARTRASFASLLILDRAPEPARVREVYERASRAVIRMRQHVVRPSYPVTAPRWVVDPDFDLDYHLRRVRLPEPGTERQLLDLVEQMVATPLDRDRPLWHVTVIEGLADGRAAVVTAMSHAITDGLGGVAMFEQIYDVTREGTARPMPLQPVPVDLAPDDLAKDALKGLPGRAVGLAASVAGTAVGALTSLAKDPVGTVGSAAGFATSLRRVLARSEAAEPSPLLARRGNRRRIVLLDLDLGELKAAATALGGTVNDAYLAALSGALRIYHEKHGVPVDSVPMAIPVSTRDGAADDGGNHWTSLTFPAPVGVGDLAERLARIRGQVREGLGEPARDLLGLLSPVVTWLPDHLFLAVSSAFGPADIQASNVRSYPHELFFAGAKVDAEYALGPLPGVACMTVMMTRTGRAFIGARYDLDSFADGDGFEAALAAGFAEVLAAGRPAHSESAVTPKATTTATPAKSTQPVKRAVKKSAAAKTQPTNTARPSRAKASDTPSTKTSRAAAARRTGTDAPTPRIRKGAR